MFARVCAHVGGCVCECVRLGVVRLTFQGPLHGIAWHPMASQLRPIPSQRISSSFSFDTCCVILCLLCCMASRGPNSSSGRSRILQPHCRHMPP